MTAAPRTIFCGVLWLSASIFPGGCRCDSDGPPAEIAVSNSYLYAVVRDLCGEDTAILSLVPPGMCPGHFDIKPSEVRRLFQTRLLLTFDFQRGIGQVLPTDGRGPTLSTVAAPQGLCVPATYLSILNETAAILSAEFPDRGSFFKQRQEEITVRIAALEAECIDAMAALKAPQAPVLASQHQAAFAEWLGLDVVSTFSGRDTETAANINAALHETDQRPLRWIIANQQEGTRLAEALADRIGAPVAVFSNFPDTFSGSASAPAFDSLVRGNLRRLAEATQ